MKITRSQLKRIIKEELQSTLKEDVLDYIEKGDTILVPDGNILLKPDGRVIFSAKNRDGDSLGDVVGQLSDDVVAKLRGGGTMEKPKEPISPIHKELMDAVGVIVAAYEGAELPPAIGELKTLIDAADFQEARGVITDIWNKVLKYHQKTGARMQHQVTTTFNTVNTLLRKLD